MLQNLEKNKKLKPPPPSSSCATAAAASDTDLFNPGEQEEAQPDASDDKEDDTKKKAALETPEESSQARMSKEDEAAILAAVNEDLVAAELAAKESLSTRNDWDAFGQGEDDTASSEDGGHAGFDDYGGQTDHRVNVRHIASLPSDKRKEAIEEAKRRQRLRLRKEFMPAAANPGQFSQVQVTNFLRSSRLNLDISQMAKQAVERDNQGMEGQVMASDRTTRVSLIRENEQHDEDDDEEEEPFDRKRPAKRLNDRPRRKRIRRESVEESSASDDEVLWDDEESPTESAGNRGEPSLLLQPHSPISQN